MIYKFGLLLLAAYVSVTSAHPPCDCARNLLLVCGSDGVTYSNECMLECAQSTNKDLTLRNQGECEPEPPICFCTFQFNPVCGSNGKNYPNECSLECEKAKSPELELASRGECPLEEVKVADVPLPTCICTLEYNPVCGSDGKSYPNECSLNCQKARSPELEVKSRGQCQNEEVKVADVPSPKCICTDEYNPVCGSDGKSYPNECELNCQKAMSPELEVKSRGQCQNEEVKVVDLSTCSCTREMKPVCGTNGITYDNPCLLNCGSEKSTTKFDLDHEGQCDDLKVRVVEQSASEAPVCVCTRDLQPVCGSDGVTYNNACLLRCAGKDLARTGPC